MEWVDTDGCVSVPSYCGIFLTSVTKGIVSSVENAALRRRTAISMAATTSGR